jgi:hypothetical protein
MWALWWRGTELLIQLFMHIRADSEPKVAPPLTAEQMDKLMADGFEQVFGEGKFTDYSIEVKGRLVRAHRAILAVRRSAGICRFCCRASAS